MERTRELYSVVVSGSEYSTEQRLHTLNITFVPDSKPERSRWKRLGRAVKVMGAASVALFLGVGVPIMATADKQGDRIINEGINPAQDSFKADFNTAKEDLKTEMVTAVDTASDEFKEEIKTYIDETVDEVFGQLLGPAPEPSADEEALAADTSTTTVPPQE